MGFFGVMADIGRNKENFKKWEQQERDNDAKRKALYERGVGKERIEEAKKRGDVIIDVITQMDQHSENMSEDIEQVTEPLSALSLSVGTIAGIAGGGYAFYRQAIKPIRNFSEETRKIRNNIAKSAEKKIDELWKENIKINPTSSYADLKKSLTEAQQEELKNLQNLRWDCYSPNIFSSKNLEKYENYINKDILKQAQESYSPKWTKLAKNAKKWGWIGAGIGLAITIGAYTGTILGTTKMQLSGSRIARWQSRNDLKDARNFVVFTDEQIAEAQANIAKNKKPLTLKEKIFGKKDKSQKGFWKNWYGFFKDRNAYNAWKANDNDDSKLITRQLSEKEIQEAKLDKELLQRITKKINNKAEEYSEDMETAASVILAMPIVTGLLSIPVTWGLEKTKILSKMSDKILKNNAPKGYVEFLNKQKNNSNKSILGKMADFFRSQIKLDELIKEEQIAKGLTNNKNSFLKNSLRKGKILLTQTPAMRKFGGFIITSAITSVATIMMALKLQKNAARAGRYIAREEFKNNPQEFLSYTDEEMKQVENVKGEKPSLKQKFNEWVTFLPTCIKNMYKYENYKKNEYQPKKELREELIKNAKISEKQLIDAKNLQNKMFNTFEKVDENSQLYSETMEAANEMAEPLIMIGGYALLVSPIIATMIGVARGKISIAKLGDWATSLLAKFGGSKLGQKVQKESIQNLTRTIENTKAETLDIQKLAQKFGLETGAQTNESIQNFFNYLNKPIKESLQLDEKTIKQLLESSDKTLDELLKQKEIKIPEDILNKKLTDIIGNANQSGRGFIQKLFKADNINDLTISYILKKINLLDEKGNILPTIRNKKIREIFRIKDEKLYLEESISDILNRNSDKITKPTLEFISKHTPSREVSFRWLRASIEAMPEELFKNTFGKLNGKKLGSIQSGTIDRKYIIKQLNKIEKILEKAENSGLKAEVGKLLETAMANPQKTMTLLINHPEKLFASMKSKTLSNALIVAGISWTAFTTLMTYLLASYFASLQKDAGRLGVMKSIEELNDYRYYANEIKESDKIRA